MGFLSSRRIGLWGLSGMIIYEFRLKEDIRGFLVGMIYLQMLAFSAELSAPTKVCGLPPTLKLERFFTKVSVTSVTH